MDVAEIFVEGYRSIRSIRFPADRLSVFVGKNGTGKTNLYRALQMLHASATGRLPSELAREGGIASALWAGKRRVNEQPKMSFEVRFDQFGDDGTTGSVLRDIVYGFELGFPPGAAHASFALEAEIKSEYLSVTTGRRPVKMLERKGGVIHVRNDEGVRTLIEDDILASESALYALGLNSTYPVLAAARGALARWRFFHGFRTDIDSPLRRASLAVTSPTLDADGRNLAAVFATLRHIREDSHDLDAAIEDAFPGSRLVVPPPRENASFALTYAEFPQRQFSAGELSDGTLHYLALVGALLSYRLPPFIALNEPETSLHPSLLEPLGRLIAKSAERAQILVVTHSGALAAAIEANSGMVPRQVVKNGGATWIEGLSSIGHFSED